MRRFCRTLLCMLLMMALTLPVSAVAYYDNVKGEYYEGDAPTFTGTLNQRMATRTGPATEFEEPGSFFKAGEQVQVISIAYDENDVPWVQVDFWYGKKHYRAYTGLKRFDGLTENELPLELTGQYGPAALTRNVKPRFGPGEDYEAYSFTLKKDRMVELLEIEGDYGMVQFYATGDKQWYRLWVPTDALW